MVIEAAFPAGERQFNVIPSGVKTIGRQVVDGESDSVIIRRTR